MPNTPKLSPRGIEAAVTSTWGRNALDDALVAGAYPTPIPDELADRIARLTLHMGLHAVRNSVVLDPRALRRWEERSPEERARLRTAVIRVLQALQLLGMLDV